MEKDVISSSVMGINSADLGLFIPIWNNPELSSICENKVGKAPPKGNSAPDELYAGIPLFLEELYYMEM